MKKGLSKLLGITLICATIIGGGALISHLALSRNAEKSVVQNNNNGNSNNNSNNNNNQSSKLVSAKHKFLTASYDFRNSIQTIRKFKNNDYSDYQSLMNFVNGSNSNLHDEDSPMTSSLGDFRATEHSYIDEDTQEEVTETIWSYNNVYKGNGGLRLGTGSAESDSTFYINLSSSSNYISASSVKLYVSSYNTIINGVDHYDSTNFYVNGEHFEISGPQTIEVSSYTAEFRIDLTLGRLIVYQIDFYFDYYGSFDFIDIDDVPKGVGYSYESIGSFKYSDVFGSSKSVFYNSEINGIEIGSVETIHQMILMESDGQYYLCNDDFNWLVVLKDYNYVLQGDSDLRLPSPSENLCINNNSEFYVFRKVTSLDPHGPQY